jgi:hypothetical protein
MDGINHPFLDIAPVRVFVEVKKTQLPGPDLECGTPSATMGTAIWHPDSTLTATYGALLRRGNPLAPL